MSALFFTGSYGQFFQEELLSQASQANSALYANPATPLFAGLYRKSLILAVGT